MIVDLLIIMQRQQQRVTEPWLNSFLACLDITQLHLRKLGRSLMAHAHYAEILSRVYLCHSYTIR